MTILSKPWRIDRRGERIYIDAPGEVCVDICSGTAEDRARVMALLEQVQRMATALRRRVETAPCLCYATEPDRCNNCDDREALRAAGVLDE